MNSISKHAAAAVVCVWLPTAACARGVEPPANSIESEPAVAASTGVEENTYDGEVANAERKKNKDLLAEIPAPGATRKHWRRLMRNSQAWIDKEAGLVIVDGFVCLRKGALEMFACPKDTKEHESVVAVETLAFAVHAALYAVGAKSGRPVQFQPEYAPPTGDEIEIYVLWVQDDELRTAMAQDWIRNERTGKAMSEPFVFAGSRIYTDEVSGARSYLAEGGEFICVANFPAAMLDVPIASTDKNEGLLFTANTEAIPEIETPVRLVLRPRDMSESTPVKADE